MHTNHKKKTVELRCTKWSPSLKTPTQNNASERKLTINTRLCQQRKTTHK
jgi:hypothetical protein